MADPQQQTFTNVTPIQQPAQQTFSNVTPIGANQSQPGFLDRDIPLDSYGNATLSGVQSIGRGVRGALKSAWDSITTPPQNSTEEAVGALGPEALPVYRAIHGLVSTAKDSGQVPAAVRDINASPDPTGTYAKVAQDTAGEGAGQALTALATEGAARLPGGKIAQSAKAIAEPAAGAIAKLPVIDKVVDAAKAVGAYKNVPGKLADIWSGQTPAAPPEVTSSSRTLPGQNTPEVIQPSSPSPGPIPPRRGLMLPEQSQSTIDAAVNSPARTLYGQNSPEIINPSSSYMKPSAPIPPRSGLALPAAPQGAELGDLPATGAKPAAQTGEALGQVPARGSVANAVQQPPVQTPAPISRGSLSQMMNDLQQKVGEGLGASPPPDPKAPIYQRGSLSNATQEGSGGSVLEGHTPLKSSALKSYKYDPTTQEFEADFVGGSTPVRYGGISPEQVQHFEQAPSQGKAFQAIKNSGTVVAKRINGKWQPVKTAQ